MDGTWAPENFVSSQAKPKPQLTGAEKQKTIADDWIKQGPFQSNNNESTNDERDNVGLTNKD